MASRSRKRRPGAGPPGPAAPSPGAKPARESARSAPGTTQDVLQTKAPSSRAAKTEAKNAAVREGLEPLGPGQRPQWVTYAAIFATVLGIGNVVLYAAGVRVKDAGAGSAIVQGAILLICAGGMWRAKYWAVMGFEVLMGVTTAFGALSLLVASSLKGALIAVGVVLVCGTFFWKLIRAMARIQMPQRPSSARA